MAYKPPTPNTVIVNAKYCFINNSCFFFKSAINAVELHYTPWVNNSMERAFTRAMTLTSVTNINNNVTNMVGTFSRCTSLVNAPVIPDSVVNMSQCFSKCTELINVTLPNNVIDISSAFSECAKLVNVPTIPNSVTNMDATFSSCTNLVNAPVIPNSVTSMASTFNYCLDLVNAPVIPDNVINMAYTFNSCTNLVNAPVIPDNVTDIEGIFSGCTNLSGDIYIKSSNIEASYYAFSGISYNVYVWAKPNTLTWNSLNIAGYNTNGSSEGNVFLREWDGTFSNLTVNVTPNTATVNIVDQNDA